MYCYEIFRLVFKCKYIKLPCVQLALDLFNKKNNQHAMLKTHFFLLVKKICVFL